MKACNKFHISTPATDEQCSLGWVLIC